MLGHRAWSATFGTVMALASVLLGPGESSAIPVSREPIESHFVAESPPDAPSGGPRSRLPTSPRGQEPSPDGQAVHTGSLDRVEFEHISVGQGLSHSSVNCILQDSTGFIWFGTNDGLNRYDGYEVVVYQPPGSDVGSGHNTINALAEDGVGGLWIGAKQGLDRLNHDTGRFTHFRHDEGDADSLLHNEVLALHRDQKHRLWIGTPAGLDRLDPGTDRFVHYRADRDDPNRLPDNRILAIYEDGYGTLWIGTWGGLARWDPAMDTFTGYRPAPEEGPDVGHNAVHSIVQGADGALWLATGGSGFYRFDPEEDEFQQLLVDPRDSGGYAHNDVRSIAQDQAGKLWLGTNGGGLYRFDPTDGQLIPHQKDPQDSHSLSSNQVNAIYESRRGVLWVGTGGGGVNKLDPDKQKFALYQADPRETNSLSQNRVLALHEDSDGILWIGTDGGGLDRLDRATGIFTHHTHDPTDPYSLSNNCVTAIHEGRDGSLWIGTWGGGIARFDRDTERFAHYQADPFDPNSLKSNMVHAIHQDHDGRLWVGTDGGLERFDRSTGHFLRYVGSEGHVRDVFEDQDHDLWFATDEGVFRLDRSSGRVIQEAHTSQNLQDRLKSESYAICQDHTGRLWVGTNSGLLSIDRRTGALEHYGKEQGLQDEVVRGILEGDRGYLWISTTGGLSRLDPTSGVFRNYAVSDGLQGYEFTGAGCRAQDGTLFFGGTSGLNSVQPDRVTDNPHPPPVVLTSVSQTGRSIVEGRSVPTVKKVRLSWPGNFFEFTFVALNYHQPEKNQYAYMLEGFDRDWNAVGTRRYGRYTNLPGGTYRLRIKAANNDGVWNEEGVSVKITVVPPFWSTWWFRGGLLLLLLAGAGAVYRVRIRGVEIRSRELEDLVTERTAALTRSNERLKREILERERAEEELARRAAEAAVAAERSRLARDLHDAVTQLLFSASLIAEAIPGIWENDQKEGRKLLEEMRRLSRGALAEMRTLLLELRPAALTETSMADLLRQLTEAAAGRTDLSIGLAVEGEPALPDDVHVALYRIAQEALNNIIKHARAERATVSIQCVPHGDARDSEQEVTLSIKDNGVGFDLGNIQPDHLGLGIIRERAERIGAELSIESQPGRGSEVQIRWRGRSL